MGYDIIMQNDKPVKTHYSLTVTHEFEDGSIAKKEISVFDLYDLIGSLSEMTNSDIMIDESFDLYDVKKAKPELRITNKYGDNPLVECDVDDMVIIDMYKDLKDTMNSAKAIKKLSNDIGIPVEKIKKVLKK